MSANTFASVCGLACLMAVSSSVAQEPAGTSPARAERAVTEADPRAAKERTTISQVHRTLGIETRKFPSELAEVFSLPPQCDADGNFYIRTNPEGDEGVRKLNSKGERVALFQAKSPDLKVNRAADFSISPGEDVYQIVHVWDISQYVFAYKADGSVKSEIKLQTSFPFSAYLLAVFPTGDLLVSGLEYDHDRNNLIRWPFTGIFSSSGDLRKELAFEDDQKIHDMAASGDPKVASVQNPSFNHAVTQGAMETAQDGNVYLMRRLSPAIFYAVSAGGEVVRRFTVDTGEENFMPVTMHIAGNRIAILFRQEQTRKEVIKVVDLEGHEVATYDEPVKDGRPALGMAFICYTSNPEGFTFLTTMENDRLGLIIASPR